MSAATAAALEPRRATRGYAQIPNSLIENMGLMTDAELRLALIMLRREAASKPIPVTEETWTRWSGLQSRMRHHAIKGLQTKGLVATGRGQETRLRFDRDQWDRFVTSTPRENTKPHTPPAARPRKVAAKEGMQVHEDCRSRGCAMLCDPSLTLVPASAVVQSVANSPADSPARLTLVPTAHGKPTGPASASAFVQSVANSPDDPTNAWPQSWAALTYVFPWVQPAFITHLVSAARSNGLTQIEDAELAQAIAHAWNRKKKRQQSEGLFIYTVPESLAMLRNVPKPKATPTVSVQDGVRTMLGRVAEALRSNGLDKLAEEVWQVDESMQLEALDAELTRLEEKIVAKARKQLDVTQSTMVGELTERAIAREKARDVNETRTLDYWKSQRERIQYLNVLNALGVPRLGLFYV